MEFGVSIFGLGHTPEYDQQWSRKRHCMELEQILSLPWEATVIIQHIRLEHLGISGKGTCDTTDSAGALEKLFLGVHDFFQSLLIIIILTFLFL
jgi:hypothetical protein